MDENMAERKTDTRENRIIRVIFAFLFSMPAFFLTPFFMSGRQATNSERLDKYKVLLGSNETILVNLVVFSFVVCAISYFWHNLRLDYPTSFIFEKFGVKIGACIFILLTSGLLLGVKHTVLFLLQYS